MNTLVIDACIAAKTFAQEPDSSAALELLRACVKNNIQMIAPDLLKYEIAQIALKKNFPLDKVVHLFDDAIFTLIEMHNPNRFIWLQAEKICQDGHIKSGYPTMYDSIYHAMAIIEDGVFITADRRHYEKAKSFGHIALLGDWEKTLDAM